MQCSLKCGPAWARDAVRCVSIHVQRPSLSVTALCNQFIFLFYSSFLFFAVTSFTLLLSRFSVSSLSLSLSLSPLSYSHSLCLSNTVLLWSNIRTETVESKHVAGPLKDHSEWLGKSGKILIFKTSQTQQAGSLEPVFAKSDMAFSYAWWCLWHFVVRLGKGCLKQSRHLSLTTAGLLVVFIKLCQMLHCLSCRTVLNTLGR